MDGNGKLKSGIKFDISTENSFRKSVATQITKFDKLVFINSLGAVNIYTVINVRDWEIILDSTLSLVNNKFYEFILPYQPFETKFVEIDSTGLVLNFDANIAITD